MANEKQYFGRRRLELILLHYLADQPELIQDIKQSCKEYGKDVVLQYKKSHGNEWLHCTAYEISTQTEYDFRIFCMWFSGHRCSIEVKAGSEYEDLENVHSGYAYYDENFYPIVGDAKLCCRKLCKIPLIGGEQIMLYLTEDENGKHFLFEPVRNNDQKFLCTLPAIYHVEEKCQRKIIVHNNTDMCVYPENDNGIPVLRCSTLHSSHNRQTENFTDSFLKIERMPEVV